MPVVTPALAYVINHALGDDTARVGNWSVLDVGRSAAVKLGQTGDGLGAWTIGYTPSRVVITWAGSRESTSPLPGGTRGVGPRIPAVLWNALMQIASQNLPREDWQVPAGVSVINVCDPSGMLPTAECPNVVNEVFLTGNEPIQPDNMYRKYSINRETGLLATVFTLPQLVEERVYLVVPSDARSWAESAGLAIPPATYDVIQAPQINPDVVITSPVRFFTS